jgi:hypothetical protein
LGFLGIKEQVDLPMEMIDVLTYVIGSLALVTLLFTGFQVISHCDCRMDDRHYDYSDDNKSEDSSYVRA